MPKYRAVITGAGLVTPLGKTLDQIWENLLQGRNGIVELDDSYPALSQYGVYIGGLFPDIECDLATMCNELSSKKHYRKYNMRDKVLLYCALYAVFQSALEWKDLEDMAAIIGTSIDFSDIFDTDTSPTKFFTSYPNMLISHLGQYIPMKNNGITIVNACCSGLQAMGEAFRKIRSGEERIILAGGVDDKLNPFCAKGFSRLGMVTNSRDADHAMCPFSKDRNGMVMSQGCGVFIIEEYEHARKRNANILGEIVGYGNCIDVSSIADASVEGKQKAMERAIEDAGISYENIGYVNAHATSTVSNDQAETIAIQNVFKEHTKDIIVNSTKSYIGHTFAACGPIQGFVCMKSLETSQTHGNRNFNHAEKDPVFILPQGKIDLTDSKYCMTNTSAVGGLNSSLIFCK